MGRDELKRRYPRAFFLDAGDLTGLQHYLASKKWIEPDDRLLSVVKAGEGNMNATLRIRTERRSLVLKQGRPWVEKYPQIPAPWGRTETEGQFYEMISTVPRIQRRMPRLLGCDGESQIVLLEDLGESSDFIGLYSGAQLAYEEFLELVDFLSELHAYPSWPDRIPNVEMRKLNHEYIFAQPLQGDGGPDLDKITPGLDKVASDLRMNAKYGEEVARLGKIYLNDGPTLLHGDYYPGSWLKTSMGVRVIDPEFCFFGSAEFDVGVFLAHLRLCDHSHQYEKTFFEWYGASKEFQPLRAFQFAGVEIMRRLIGVAQLPLKSDLAWKSELLSLSKDWVLRPSL